MNCWYSISIHSMKIIFWYSNLYNWSLYDLCYHRHLALSSPFGRYLLNMTEMCFKLVVAALVRYLFIYAFMCHSKSVCPVGWGCRIHQLLLCRGVRPPHTHTLKSVLDMTLNNLMERLQWCWSFWECRTHLHCHCSQVHSGLEW